MFRWSLEVTNVNLFLARIASQYPSIQVSEAIRSAEMTFPGNYSGHPTKLEYFYKQDGSAALVHSIQIEDIYNAVSLEVYMDAHTGEAVGSTDFVSFAKVYDAFSRNISILIRRWTVSRCSCLKV